jgi:hypothetical protein
MTDISYETDFYAWTQQQAQALRAKELAKLDLEHLAEEIESVGASDRRAIRHQLVRLVKHRLKWDHQPTRRTESWRDSMSDARLQIELVLADSHSLVGFLPEALAWAYPHARREAAKDTGLPPATFPEACPWSLEQLQDPDFVPEADPGGR